MLMLLSASILSGVPATVRHVASMLTFFWTKKVLGVVGIWWLVNRVLCEKLKQMDTYLSFAQVKCHACPDISKRVDHISESYSTQVAGVLGEIDLKWPSSFAAFLDICGILDFDGAPSCDKEKAFCGRGVCYCGHTQYRREKCPVTMGPSVHNVVYHY